MTVDRLGKDGVLSLICKISVPTTVAMIATALYSIVDSAFIGKYIGSEGLAAASILSPVEAIILPAGALFIGVGAVSIIAPAIGAQDYAMVDRIMSYLLFLGLIYTVVIPIIFVPLMDLMVRGLGAATEQIVKYAVQYGQVSFGTGPFCYMFAVGMLPLLRCENRAFLAMWLQIAAALINIIVDAIIYVSTTSLGTLPAAISTTIGLGTLSIVTIFILAFPKKGSVLKLSLKLKPFSCAVIGRIMWLGCPQLINTIPQNLGSILSNLLIKKLNLSVKYPNSTDEMLNNIAGYYQASYGLVSRIGFLTYMPLNGIYQGYLSIVGYNLGAKLYKRVYEILWKTLLIMMILIVVLIIIVETCTPYIVLLFIDGNNQDLKDIAVRSIRIALCGYVMFPLVFLPAGLAQMENHAVTALCIQSLRSVLNIAFQCLFPLVFIKNDPETIVYGYPTGDFIGGFVGMGFLIYKCLHYKKLGMQSSETAAPTSEEMTTVQTHESLFVGASGECMSPETLEA